MEKNSERYVNTDIWETDERNAYSDFVTRHMTINAGSVPEKGKVLVSWRVGQAPGRRRT